MTFCDLYTESLPLFRLKPFRLRLASPPFVPGCHFSGRLQFLTLLFAVSLQSLSLEVLGNLRYEKSDGIFNPSRATQESFAPGKFDDLFDSAIGSRSPAVFD